MAEYLEKDMDNFPLPEVAEALRPYIRSRQEVAEIRRGLQGYLQRELPKEGTPLSATNLVNQNATQLGSPARVLSCVRLAYWKALRAHNEAQAKYDALKVEIDQLTNPPESTTADKAGDESIGDTQAYVSLLRQRERQRKIKVIEQAFIDVSNEAKDVSITSLDEVVKRRVGEPPVVPATQPMATRSPMAETKIMELKKAVLSTKRSVDEKKIISSTAIRPDASAVSIHVEIAGLQSALQELTNWMESQLTIIAEAEAQPQLPATPGHETTASKAPASSKDVEALYEQYLEARSGLISTMKTINNPIEPHAKIVVDDPGERSKSSSSRSQSESTSKSVAEIVLPYIPALLAAKQAEQALIQQNAYTRRNLSAAEAEMERLIHRLANESYLVQPGATGGNDWAEAAREAGTATKSFVEERVAAGEASAESAKDVLQRIEALPAMLSRATDKP